MSYFDAWLALESDEELLAKSDRDGLERLATDPFAWLDEFVAERRGISVEELRLGHLGRNGGRYG